MANALIILFGITIFYISSTSRIEGYIKALSFQGLLLFLLISMEINKIPLLASTLLIIETLGLKTFLIPWFLMHIVRKNNIYREIEPNIPSFYSVVLTTLIFSFGFFVAFWTTRSPSNIQAVYFSISISAIISGLLIILNRKKIITHIMGFMILENGTFLLSLAVAEEMPLLVNLGMLLDIFVGVFLLGIMVTRIHTSFEELDVDILTNLKD
ncbi:MAG: hypothetical protein PHW04_03705 [Candidatus Wallbacteria bacterium]|nr:hypothetical protein [Candidatus Wallbacteria bacterium]